MNISKRLSDPKHIKGTADHEHIKGLSDLEHIEGLSKHENDKGLSDLEQVKGTATVRSLDLQNYTDPWSQIVAYFMDQEHKALQTKIFQAKVDQ